MSKRLWNRGLIVVMIITIVGGIIMGRAWVRTSHPNPVQDSTDNVQPHAASTASPYLGSQACAECHSKIVESFRASGMGRSMGRVEAVTQVEDYDNAVSFLSRPEYRVERIADGVFHHERLTGQNDQVIYDQSVRIDYVIGSGNQGRSYVTNRSGMLFMSPIGWYSRAGRWDLSPGYKPPHHERFERPVTEGCLECHAGRMNARPDQENRFRQHPLLEESIGCERCHGPGRDHVQYRQQAGTKPDSDPIVNPGRLDPARREDVCNQCHLQGEGRYLRDGVHYGSFEPGQRLEEAYVILVRGTRATKEQTQAVSQVEQMRSSVCFQQSDGRFGCISCHDPHSQPDRATQTRFYRDKCLACHQDRGCKIPEPERRTRQADDSCVVCHMPRLNASDVPHTTQTDHRVLREPKDSRSPDPGLNEQVEVFDGADRRLPKIVVDRARGIWLAEQVETHAELAPEATRLLGLVLRQRPKDAEVLNALGNAAVAGGQVEDALTWWKQALQADPHRELTLRATAIQLQKLGRHAAARTYFEQYVQIQPNSAAMWTRYSHTLGQLGDVEPAVVAARKAVEINPSDWRTFQWLAELYRRQGNHEQNRSCLQTVQQLQSALQPSGGSP